jgi:hypothetical protein
MLTKLTRKEGPEIFLPSKFKTSLFSGDNIGESSSYGHLVLPIGTVLSSDYTSIRISLTYAVVPIYVYHLIQFTIYNNIYFVNHVILRKINTPKGGEKF